MVAPCDLTAISLQCCSPLCCTSAACKRAVLPTHCSRSERPHAKTLPSAFSAAALYAAHLQLANALCGPHSAVEASDPCSPTPCIEHNQHGILILSWSLVVAPNWKLHPVARPSFSYPLLEKKVWIGFESRLGWTIKEGKLAPWQPPESTPKNLGPKNSGRKFLTKIHQILI